MYLSWFVGLFVHLFVSKVTNSKTYERIVMKFEDENESRNAFRGEPDPEIFVRFLSHYKPTGQHAAGCSASQPIKNGIT